MWELLGSRSCSLQEPRKTLGPGNCIKFCQTAFPQRGAVSPTAIFSWLGRDQGSCSSFPRLDTAQSMWLSGQYRSSITSNWALIAAADNPLRKLPTTP